MASSKVKWSLFWLARHRPYGLVLLSGLLLVASFPPLPTNHLIFIAFVPLFVLGEKGIVEREAVEDGIFLPFKRIAVVSWRILTLQFIWRRNLPDASLFRYKRKVISGSAQLFRFYYAVFFLWNLGCCYWLVLPALDARDFFAGLGMVLSGVLAIALNPLLMVLPWQLHARIRHYMAPELAGLLMIAFWLTFEFLHHLWELSWPWLTVGNALSFHPALIQYAEFTGVLGVSLQIMLVNWLIYVGLRWARRERWVFIVVWALTLVAMLGPGFWNAALSSADRPALAATGQLRVRIVQPNIDPYGKENGFTAEKQIAHYACLITSEPLDSGRIVLLPEKAVDQALDARGMLKRTLLDPLWAIVDSYGVEIMTGLEEYEDYDSAATPPISARESYRLINGKRRVVLADHYNGAWIMNSSRSTHVYRKGKLVPMVERVPFLRGLRALKFLRINPAKGMQSYGRPDSLQLMYTLDSIPTNMMVCYESAFGDHTRRKTAMGARWIAMLTNDAWWRQSSGYVQHAGMSVLRAIENRRDLVRCANNGRSMVISANGQVRYSSDWSTEAVHDATIDLHDYQTYYVRHGDYIGWWASGITAVMALAWLGMDFWWRRKQRRAKQEL